MGEWYKIPKRNKESDLCACWKQDALGRGNIDYNENPKDCTLNMMQPSLLTRKCILLFR